MSQQPVYTDPATIRRETILCAAQCLMMEHFKVTRTKAANMAELEHWAGEDLDNDDWLLDIITRFNPGAALFVRTKFQKDEILDDVRTYIRNPESLLAQPKPKKKLLTRMVDTVVRLMH